MNVAIMPEPDWTYSQITESVISTFGIPHFPFGIIFTIALMLGLGIVALIFTRSYLLSMIAPLPALFIGLWLGFIPIWLALMLGAFAFSTVWLYGFGGSSEVPQGETPSTYWQKYGDNIKLAYAAKFGGRNAGFDDEVNTRINIMEHNGRGFTRTLANEWLKRMSRFTESK